MALNKAIFQKHISIWILLVIYCLAVLCGYVILISLAHWHPLIQLAIADLAATLVVFLFSFVLRNSSIYDPYWSVIPIFIGLWWMAYAPDAANVVRQIVIMSLITIWGIRLTYNFLRGWDGLNRQDWRYDMLKQKHGKNYWLVSFGGIHLLPTIVVFLGCMPLYYSMRAFAPFQVMDIVATIITAGAIIVETMADEQLRRFKLKGSKKLMDEGLWRYSRHPNYFGEVTFWIGIFMFCFASGIGDSWWTAVGFTGMIMLFVFISIPMMERRQLVRRPDYKTYMARVSILIPWFDKR